MTKQRFWEIDFIRGIAILLMFYFHAVWDLVSFDAIDIDMSSFAWQIFGKSIGFTFVFIAGLSLTLGYNKAVEKNVNAWCIFWQRGLILLGLGLIISIVTYFIFDRQYVRFGILHLLGTAIIIAYPFLQLTWIWNAILGCILISLGNYLLTYGVAYPWLLPFGLMPWGIVMVDYYPLLPWFGVVLWGIAGGKIIYKQGKRQYNLKDYSSIWAIDWVAYLGRRALFIYLIHQPIIIGFSILTGLLPLSAFS
jgi:uncharacterized membrane protein